jgi:hypothetical protein
VQDDFRKPLLHVFTTSPSLYVLGLSMIPPCPNALSIMVVALVKRVCFGTVGNHDDDLPRHTKEEIFSYFLYLCWSWHHLALGEASAGVVAVAHSMVSSYSDGW